MMLPTLLIIIGFALLIQGANWVVNGATLLAKKYRISDLAIGLTVVAFGTSAPELVINAAASLNNYPSIVFGNVIGSNNFNLFMILGIVGLIYPIRVQTSTVWKEIPISLVAVGVLYFLVNGIEGQADALLSRMDGVVLIFLFLLFLFYVYRQLKQEVNTSEISEVVISNYKIWGFIIIGMIGLLIGGKLVVDNAIQIAENLGISQKIIGLTIIAAGTSLPELITSVVAAFKKNSDLAVGNIIGSNIFNILFVLSVSSLVHPISFDIAFNRDLYLLVGGTIFLFVAMFTGEKKKLDRWEAAILLLVFMIYTIYLINQEI